MRSPFVTLGRFIAICLVAFAMSFALLLIFQSIFNPFHVVLTNSMSPYIKAGDAVVIKDVDPEEVDVGDIIIFLDPDEKERFVIHRVVDIENQEYVRLFTTKGDNNPASDADRIPSGQVVGGMAVRLPHFGSFLNFISSPGGYVSCIAIPAGLSMFLIFMLAVLDRADRRRRGARNPFKVYPTSGYHGY